jgi:hypothetical protein
MADKAKKTEHSKKGSGAYWVSRRKPSKTARSFDAATEERSFRRTLRDPQSFEKVSWTYLGHMDIT